MMLWNMDYTLPTIVLLVIIAAAFLCRKRLPIRVNKTFTGLLATDFLTMMLDYSSTGMDELGPRFSDGLLWFVNWLFFVFFLLRSYYFFRFAMELTGQKPDDHSRARKVFACIFVLDEVILFFGCLTGWIFTIHHGEYKSGPMYPFINAQFAFWIIAALLFTIKSGHTIRIRNAGVYVYLTLLLIGVCIRALFPHVVIMNLFCLFAIQVIYLLYLNPDQYIDPITGLFNNQGWDRMLAEADTHKNFCMVGFGIRNYAGFRQLRGNKKKNESLYQIGSWVARTWPSFSNFYLGDGRFVIVSIHPFDENQALDEINRRFAQPWLSDHGDYFLSVNRMVMEPGLHTQSNDMLRGTAWDAYHLLNRQDAADIIHLDKALIAKHERKVEIQKILRDALNHEKLEMFLQPIVNTANDHVEGAEALCRLPDGNGGYIFPDEFIPLAMNNGSMDLLGHQMLRHACRFMSREDVRWSNIQWVNVNVAPEQFQNPNLLNEFLDILSEYHIEPAKIHLEITEETMIDRELLHESMAKFIEKGFIFALDDFGSSYSNMIRLQQNQFASVKIDKDFTWGYFSNPTSLLPDIIHTCHDLGIKVVTEGVETKDMADGIKAIHGDYIQGYYYSKPIPWKKFIEKYVQM